MRNLKRVLSLALALVMVLGMMVITTSAATFTDADEITYTEAVDVISMIGVINGIPAGDGTFYFDADKVLTREEGAALICYLLMGKDAADKLVGSGNFSDVASSRWSAGEIDYCVNLGYIAGRGDGTFDPAGKLTAVAYGKLLLCALGYDAKNEGYESDNWAAAIAADMIDVGLDVDGVAMDDALTREAAAQMTLQALSADMVYYPIKGTSITIDGVTINTGASAATKTGDTLMEKYFEGLEKGGDSANDHGVPGYYWTYGKDEVFVADEALATYTSAQGSAAAKKAIANTFKKYTVNAVVVTDGVEGDAVASTDEIAALTSNTAVVAVYGDAKAKTVDTIVVTKVHAAALGKDDVVEADAKTETPAHILVDGIVYETEDYAKGDVVLYTKVAVDGKDEIVTIKKAESITATLTSYNSKDELKIDGKTYEVAKNAVGSKAAVEAVAKGALGDEMVYYFGTDGKIVYVTDVTGAPPAVITDYAYILAVDVDYITTKTSASGFGDKEDAEAVTGVTAQVQAVLSDGTYGVYDLAVTEKDDVYSAKIAGKDVVLYDEENKVVGEDAILADLVDKLYTYKLAEGVITLAEVVEVEAAKETITAKSLSVDGILINDDTVVILHQLDKKGNPVYLTKNVADLEETEVKGALVLAASIKDADNKELAQVATVVFAVDTKFAADTTEVLDVASIIYVDGVYSTGLDEKGGKVYTYTGVKVDGTSVDVTGEKDMDAGVYMVNAKGEITALDTDVATKADATVQAVAGTTYLMTDGSALTIGADVAVVAVAKDAELEAGAGIIYIQNAKKAVVAVYVVEAAE